MPISRHSKMIMTNYLQVKDSPGKGRGVFARTAFKRGAIIEIAPTVVIESSGDADVLALTKLSTYFFEDAEGRTVLGLGYSSMYNFSTTPNSTWAIGDGFLLIKALEDIKPGEEITFDYGWDDESYAANHIELD